MSAGRLVAGGNGVRGAAKSSKGRQTLVLRVRERRAGRLRSRIVLRFVPAGGGGWQRGKGGKVLRETVVVGFR